MGYNDNEYKQFGSDNEAVVFKRLIKFLSEPNFINSDGFKIISYEHSSLYEDMKLKFDYVILFDLSTPFYNLSCVKVDVKSTDNFTLYSHNGINNLQMSESDIIVFNNTSTANIITIVDTKDLKKLLEKYTPNLSKVIPITVNILI